MSTGKADILELMKAHKIPVPETIPVKPALLELIKAANVGKFDAADVTAK